MSYTVQFAASAAKEFRALPASVKARVTTAIDGLVDYPRPPGVSKLQGHERLYRLRVGQYRVVYAVNDEARTVRVTRIRHRREVAISRQATWLAFSLSAWPPFGPFSSMKVARGWLPSACWQPMACSMRQSPCCRHVRAGSTSSTCRYRRPWC